MKSKSLDKVGSVKGALVASKDVADSSFSYASDTLESSSLSQLSKALTSSSLSQLSKTLDSSSLANAAKVVASSSLAQIHKDSINRYMTRTHDAFARGLAAPSSDSELGALAGRVLKSMKAR